jgi:NTP pyrophosphatase (non-canonical NTP hydrolase)
MYNKMEEALDILQEECAEVIQIVSKIKRFGMKNNQERLVQEIGDLYCMMQIIEDLDLIKWEDVLVAAKNKEDKLKNWSKLYE